MKILLVYPEYPVTFWSFKHALKFVSKKAVAPPLGLLTVAALLPREFTKKLVDMNVSSLDDPDIEWADYVFISAMAIQRESADKVIARCRELGVKTVAGGALFTASYADFKTVDHLVLNEAEVTLPIFLKDLKNGRARHLYSTKERPELKDTPVPLWDLIDMNHYSTMNIQYSRGCPFDCDFCDIGVLYGHQVRTKSGGQMLAELESLYSRGWKGSVFMVDDNFIGNKTKLKREILPSITGWMEERNHPFTFDTEASINLADDEELMKMMTAAGFNSVFIGIETPDEKGLEECSKYQNKDRDLLASVKKIQEFGLMVTGGFIVGFDSDTPAIFNRMISFIQESGIVTAMVGILNAPLETRLYKRLENEGRIIENITGSNTDLSMNFIPRMNRDTLITGYKTIVNTIYSSKDYYKRIRILLRQYQPMPHRFAPLKLNEVGALFKSIIRLGILGRERIHYWKLFFWSIFRRPKLFPLAITFAIYGFHFRKIIKA
jgi:radical SAM superfamily enzyme YgiQ (UPF0313 family)